MISSQQIKQQTSNQNHEEQSDEKFLLAQKKHKIESISNMCICLGIHRAVYQNNKQSYRLSHMPISLFPYELTQKTYNILIKAHQIWQKLLLAVARDHKFVNQTFEKVAKIDPFVSRILNLYNKYHSPEYGVACTRIDYMGDQQPKLVEFNLMSVGLNGISDRVQQLGSLIQQQRTLKGGHYPKNRNQYQFCNAIEQVLAVYYNKKYSYKHLIVIIIHQKQFNLGDQNAFQLQMLNRGYYCKKLTMKQLNQSIQYNKETNECSINGLIVSLFYYRSMYRPDHYLSQQYWNTKELIEQSRAIKIPSIDMEIINYKRMQCQFEKIQILNKYLSLQQAKLIHSFLDTMENFENKQLHQTLLQKSLTGNYVLKVNREGGGNNIFGKQVHAFLLELNSQQRQAYMLMKMIKPRIQSNIFISGKGFEYIKHCTTQLSTFGSFSYHQNKIMYNQCGGSLVRIKKQSQNQGSIAWDLAVISSIYLY